MTLIRDRPRLAALLIASTLGMLTLGVAQIHWARDAKEAAKEARAEQLQSLYDQLRNFRGCGIGLEELRLQIEALENE